MPLFDSSNLPYWILLGVGVLLFLFIIVFGGGDDDTDFDSDLGLDVDSDVDPTVGHSLDLDTNADASDFSVLRSLGWFGVGKAPLLILLAVDFSLWGIIGWMLNVAIGGVLGSLLGGLAGGIILMGSFVASLILGGQIAKPIGKIFASFGEDTSGDRLVGCVGIVSTGQIPAVSTGKIGQVDVLDPAHNRVTVNAMLPEWARVLPQRGEKVLVIERSGSGYLVVVKDSADQAAWFDQSNRLTDSR